MSDENMPASALAAPPSAEDPSAPEDAALREGLATEPIDAAPAPGAAPHAALTQRATSPEGSVSSSNLRARLVRFGSRAPVGPGHREDHRAQCRKHYPPEDLQGGCAHVLGRLDRLVIDLGE